VALNFLRVSLTFGMFTQMTNVCTGDWKVATRSCRDRSLLVVPSLTWRLPGYIADPRNLSWGQRQRLTVNIADPRILSWGTESETDPE